MNIQSVWMNIAVTKIMTVIVTMSVCILRTDAHLLFKLIVLGKHVITFGSLSMLQLFSRAYSYYTKP